MSASSVTPTTPAAVYWTREELEKAMEVYKNNNCIVISDEIWADLVMNGNVQTPTQEVSEDAKHAYHRYVCSFQDLQPGWSGSVPTM